MDNWLIFQYSLIFAPNEPNSAKAEKLIWFYQIDGSADPTFVVVQQWCDTGRQSSPGDGCPGVRR